ncbi:MAG TPA: FAD-binding oxidoreductase [Bryobacteraceae bacterium]|nr:FAD-binding oxidoreductase [Bryobacteraceae bacterium]
MQNLQAARAAGIAAAVEKWRLLLGPQHVITDPDCLKRAAGATFPTANSLVAILKPASREQVQECVRVANRYGTPLYPISSGKNWGYGSRAPSADGCVLVDLGRMRTIVDFSEELAYITVEPGVTQNQVIEFLRARNSRLWIDATGSSPDCSLIGNACERGFGHTPYADHFAHTCALEVVLPTGELAHTGFGRFDNAFAAPIYRWGFGPSIDGLFSQSNLGIVTRMTFWLMPAPECFQAFFFRCGDERQLHDVIDALRRLRLGGTLRSAMHIGNDYKVLSGIQQYPWSESHGRTPLPADVMEGLRRRYNFGRWNGSGALYGTRRQVAEARRIVKAALNGKVDQLQFLDDRRIALASRFAGLYRMVTGWDLTRALELVKPVMGLMRGIPTQQPLRSVYWRRREPVPEHMDPDRDHCGLLWCGPVAPATGEHAIALARIAESTLLSYGFEPMISFTMLSERALGCVTTITYDRAVAGEDDRAMECYRALSEGFERAGYFPYRLGIQGMDRMNGNNGYNAVVRTIKNALDPNRILAPGRYDPQ